MESTSRDVFLVQRYYDWYPFIPTRKIEEESCVIYILLYRVNSDGNGWRNKSTLTLLLSMEKTLYSSRDGLSNSQNTRFVNACIFCAAHSCDGLHSTYCNGTIPGTRKVSPLPSVCFLRRTSLSFTFFLTRYTISHMYRMSQNYQYNFRLQFSRLEYSHFLEAVV